MKLKENKGITLIVLTIILSVLVVLAGGVIVYLLNNQQSIPKTPTGEQNNIVNNESTANKNENNIDLKLTDLVGNYEVIIGPDGQYNIEIKSDGEKLNFNWTAGHPDSYVDIVEVKEYKLENNKLVVEVEENDIELKCIIFKENGKTYFTIEGIENEEGFDYFPIEMSNVTDKNEDNKDVKLTDFVGNYEFAMGPDGPNTIKITSDGEGLKIEWLEGTFNGSDARTIKVKTYKLEGNKLILEVEGQSNSIIFKENGKTYFTIEGIENEEGFSYFPIEMTKK